MNRELLLSHSTEENGDDVKEKRHTHTTHARTASKDGANRYADAHVAYDYRQCDV